MENCVREMETIAGEFPGEIGVLWQGMAGGPFFALNAYAPYVAASTIKPAILLCALQAVALGERTLGDIVEVLPQDILYDSIPFEPGPRPMPLEELLRWMILVSDNTSSNVLIRLLGMDAINAYCRGLGLRQTRLERLLLDDAARARGLDNYTSPADQYILYRALYRGDILTPALCRFALDALGDCRDFSMLARYIAGPVRLCHKSGQLTGIHNDAGLFYAGDEPYFLAVFTSSRPMGNQARKAIGSISRAAWSLANP